MDVRALLLLWLCSAPSAGCTYTTINTRQHQVVYYYPHGYRSERDLPICEEDEACNVLYKRFWLPPVAQRLCRCGSKDECPWKWTNETDTSSVFLNNRSQIKFCSSIEGTRDCYPGESALNVSTLKVQGKVTRQKVSVSCRCPFHSYWKFYKMMRHANAVNKTTHRAEQFRCVELKYCDSFEFCGNARIDQNSIYYRCSCPKGHLCIYSDKTIYNATELLYKGPIYKAYCEPFETE